MRIRSALASALVVLLPMSASGQEPPLTQPASIPIDLALALTGSGGLGSEAEVQILVGAIPEWALNRVSLPNGWRPIGSAFLGTTVIGVVQVPTGNDSLIQRFQQHLERNGWKAPPPPTVYRGGGFQSPQSAAATARASRRFQSCRDNHTLNAWIARELPLSTTIAFRLGTPNPGQFNQCNPPAPDPRMLASMRESPYPTLFDPVSRDGPMMSSCYDQRSFGSSATETRYKASLTPEQVLDHYARQLADSGWMAGSPPRPTIARAWTRPDPAGGEPRHVTLTVSRPTTGDSTCLRVQMEVRDRVR